MEKISNILPEGRENKVEQAVEAIRKIEENREILGEGKCGQVFASPGSSICVKKILHPERKFSINSAQEEMNLLSQAAQAGVRVPHPISTVDAKEGTYILMEKVDGHSVRDIIMKNIPLPASFDFDKFCLSLDRETQKMHNAGIHHRDLHEGNVMVEWKGGEAEIVDFGHSCAVFSEEDDPYRETGYPIPGKTYNFPKDEVMAARVKSSLIEHLQNTKNSL